MRLTRRKTVPEGVAVERGERVLAVGGDAVATQSALYLAGAGGTVRLPWEHVDQAGWHDGVLTVREVDGTRHAVRLAEPASIPETVRERVTAAVLVSTHVRLPGGGVRVVGRRAPAGDGTVHWAFVFDSGLNADDPGLRAQAEQALEEIRRQTGL
jgi:hypothetical protein